MKMIIAKLKKSTILKKAIAGILTSSIALFSFKPVYASTSVDQETLYPILKTSSQEYLYPVTGTSHTLSRYTTITDVLSQFAEQSTLNQKSIYTLMNTIGGYVDGIEGYIDGIEGYIDGIEGQISTSNTHLNAIKGYVDGVEGKIDTSNTRLNDIKSAIQNITTYNYTQILSDILTNTGYLSTIDTYTQSMQDSIGYGTSGDNVLSKLSSLINSNTNIYTNTNNLYTYVTDFTARNSQVWWRTSDSYSLRRTGQSGSYNIGGFAIPERATSNNNNSETYRWKYLAGSNSNLMSALESLSITSNFTLSKLMTPYSSYLQPVFDINTNSLVTMKDDYGYTVGALSLADIIDHFNKQFLLHLGKLQYVLADDDTIDAKNANKAQEQAVLTNFTGQGSSSASANDFVQLSNAVGSVKSGLNTNASPTDVLTVFNSTDGFGWFSQATLDELDTTTQNTRLMKASSDTPLYDSNYNAIMEYLTGGNRK